MALLHLRQPGLDGRPATGAGGAGAHRSAERSRLDREKLRRSAANGPASAARIATGSATTRAFAWLAIGLTRGLACSGRSSWAKATPGRRWPAGASMYWTTIASNRPTASAASRWTTAKRIWAYRYPNEVKRNHGMSRTVPAVIDKYVVSLGPKCHVLCLDPADGRRRWMLDLVRQYGARVPEWYAGQCPLVETDWPSGPRAILCTRRAGAAGGGRLPDRSGPLEEPEPARLADDPRLDRPHEACRAADVRLLRQGRRGRGGGGRRHDPLANVRLEDQHRHLPLAGDPARGQGFPLRRLQFGLVDAPGEGRLRPVRGQELVPPQSEPVRFHPAHADLLPGASLRRAGERQATGLPRSGRQGGLVQRQPAAVRRRALPDRRRADLRAGRAGHSDAGRGRTVRLQGAGPRQVLERRRLLGTDGPGSRPADRPRFHADGLSRRGREGGAP